MASFSAELHVAGHVFPVMYCHFEVEQATQQRGRVGAKVRYGSVQLVLDVPDGDVLAAWAAGAHKRQAASVVFLNAHGGRAVETLRLPAAYCVAYREQFVSGDAQGGAYQCFLTLSDPTGWTIAPGGPASAFVAAAAREHGAPGASGLRDIAIGGIPVADVSAGTSDQITVSRDFVGEVPMEHSDLGRMALEFRRAKTANNWHGGNVTVFEYTDANGNLCHLIQETNPEVTKKHAERLALENLKQQGIPSQNVHRIYSELEPCETPDGGIRTEGCKAMLIREYPQAKVTYSYEYRGSTAATRQARMDSMARKAAYFEKYKKN